jgi:4-nitrophenyl phosphatase
MTNLSTASVFVFDLDGVLYRGETSIPHASEAVNRLQERGKRVYFLTNNSASTRRSYCEKLLRVNGLTVSEPQIYTSAYAAAAYLSADGAAGRSVFVIGESGLCEDLAGVGLKVVTEPDQVDYRALDYVVVGIDRRFSYDKLRFAHAAITRGHARFIATNRDATFPMETGEIPGSGSLVAAVAAAVGHEPFTIGKPEVHAYEAILRAACASPQDSVMIGDRLDTDIALGNRVGASTILVLTGVTSKAAADEAPRDWLPTRIIGSLAELEEAVAY